MYTAAFQVVSATSGKIFTDFPKLNELKNYRQHSILYLQTI